MRQSMFAACLLVKVALCWDIVEPLSSWFVNLMVSLSLVSILMCLPSRWVPREIQLASIVAQWLLALLWSYNQTATVSGTLVWELMVIMVIELMLYYLISFLERGDKIRHSRRR